MAKLVRYLVRRKTEDVYIWTKMLAKRKDLEEVFARGPEEAVKKPAMPNPDTISLDDLETLTKEDLLLFGIHKLGMDLEQMDPKRTKDELLDIIKPAVFARGHEPPMEVPGTEQMNRPRGNLP